MGKPLPLGLLCDGQRLGEFPDLERQDARGFIRINALRLRAHKLILRRTGDDEASAAVAP